MREIEKIAQTLFDKIRSRFENVSIGDEKAKVTTDPEKARFLNFNYISDTGDHFGNITLSLIDGQSLKVYFSKGISEKLGSHAKQEWYAFLKDLRKFARRNLLGFDTRDISRPNLSVRDLRQTSHTDSPFTKSDVTESRLFGSTKSSYERLGPTKIIIRHGKSVDEAIHGSRSRNIESIFIQNESGERFKLPFNKLSGARAMARHVTNGGQIHDDLGKHICNVVNEMSALKIFVRANKNHTFEDAEATAMMEAAVEQYLNLHSDLRHLSGNRGYQAFKESFKPMVTEEDDFNLDEVKQKFIRKSFDERITEALPHVYRAYKKKMATDDPLVNEFAQWATRVTEGTWELPETDEQIEQLNSLLADPLPVGVDGDNATSVLYNLVGDDELFDTLYSISKAEGPEVDARPHVILWMQDNYPLMLEKLTVPEDMYPPAQQDEQPSEEQPPEEQEFPDMDADTPDQTPPEGEQPDAEVDADEPDQTPPEPNPVAEMRRLAGL